MGEHMSLSRHTIQSIEYDCQVEQLTWTRILERLGGTVYLAVPFVQKDAAKQAGARWDRTARKWYVDNWNALADCWCWVPAEQKLSP